MAEEQKQQSVADTNEADSEKQDKTQASPNQSDAGGAQDNEPSLDELLADWPAEQQEAQSSKSEQTTEDSDAAKKALEKLEAWERKEMAKEAEQEVGRLAESVRGELDPEYFDDDFVEGWLERQAQKNPALSNAWQQRKRNPAQWKKVETQLAKQFQQKYGKRPDKDTTEDVAAVESSVRSASTKGPRQSEDIDPSEFRKMSNAQFEKWMQEQIRKAG